MVEESANVNELFRLERYYSSSFILCVCSVKHSLHDTDHPTPPPTPTANYNSTRYAMTSEVMKTKYIVTF